MMTAASVLTYRRQCQHRSDHDIDIGDALRAEVAFLRSVKDQTMALVAVTTLGCGSLDGSAARHDADGARGFESYPVDGQGLYDGEASGRDASLDEGRIDRVEGGDERPASDA